MEGVQKETVADWVRAIGSTPTDVNDPATNWRMEFDYPSRSAHRLHVLQPEGMPHQVLVLTGINVSHDHLEAFGELPEEDQKEFALNLRRVMNRPEVDFVLEGNAGPGDCPRIIQLSKARYSDGLSLDSFADTVGQVFKAELHTIWYFEDRFGEHRNGNGGGRFDFKRAGL